MGITTKQASEYLKKYGPNAIPEKHDSVAKKILQKTLSPISLMLLTAAILSVFINKVFDCYFILSLLIMNLFITIWQENKADTAIRKLNENLAETVKVMRDGVWQKIDSRNIVPGDILEISAGEIIPADGELLETKGVSVNESALTGESLPKQKTTHDKVYSGSFVNIGIAQMRIMATGRFTSFGKTLFSVERIRKKSLLENDVIQISKFLSILSFIAIIILTITFLYEKMSLPDLLILDLSLLIAGIPISLPTVMTLIIEFGVINLSKKEVIIRRISALEDLANVNLLLTDKTGTLTQNAITVQKIIPYEGSNEKDVLSFAFPLTQKQEGDPIDDAIAKRAVELGLSTRDYEIEDFTPADSVRKRGTVTATIKGNKVTISFGAPQIIASLCTLDESTTQRLNQDIAVFAQRGFRTLAVSVNKNNTDEKNMQLIGLIALSDTLREDATDVVQFLEHNGVSVTMVTGDNKVIAHEVAKTLHLDDGKVITKAELDALDWNHLPKRIFETTGAFAEILPEDKCKLVVAAKNYFVVAATGDGVNDIPAIKAAHVGIAVKTAVNALKASTDVVLLSNGISIIKEALVESRKIFARVYSYSVYRISESLRLIVSIAILGVFYHNYPLTPLQLILLAILNDIPIISLAWDRVKTANAPAKIDLKKRFTLSSVLGLAGVANSILLFIIMLLVLHLPWGIIQTLFFLKLTVSGHLLIYVARTNQKWWKFLPSRQVIWATALTQLLATCLALTGFFMPSKVSLPLILLVWAWSFIWMQISELLKQATLTRS